MLNFNSFLGKSYQSKHSYYFTFILCIRRTLIKYGADVPLNFPLTVRALKELEIGPDLTRVENYYSLPHTGSLSVIRKKRILRTYGIGIVVE